MKNESISTKKIVMTAFFAAIIYLGIQSFRIPLPAAVGTPFLHFGHIFVMLAVLMLDLSFQLWQEFSDFSSLMY